MVWKISYEDISYHHQFPPIGSSENGTTLVFTLNTIRSIQAFEKTHNNTANNIPNKLSKTKKTGSYLELQIFSLAGIFSKSIFKTLLISPNKMRLEKNKSEPNIDNFHCRQRKIESAAIDYLSELKRYFALIKSPPRTYWILTGSEIFTPFKSLLNPGP